MFNERFLILVKVIVVNQNEKEPTSQVSLFFRGWEKKVVERTAKENDQAMNRCQMVIVVTGSGALHVILTDIQNQHQLNQIHQANGIFIGNSGSHVNWGYVMEIAT